MLHYLDGTTGERVEVFREVLRAKQLKEETRQLVERKMVKPFVGARIGSDSCLARGYKCVVSRRTVGEKMADGALGDIFTPPR